MIIHQNVSIRLVSLVVSAEGAALPINHQPRILNTIGACNHQVYQPSNDPFSKRCAQFNHHHLSYQSMDPLPLILLSNGAPPASVIVVGVLGGYTIRARMVGVMRVAAIR